MSSQKQGQHFVCLFLFVILWCKRKITRPYPADLSCAHLSDFIFWYLPWLCFFYLFIFLQRKIKPPINSHQFPLHYLAPAAYVFGLFLKGTIFSLMGFLLLTISHVIKHTQSHNVPTLCWRVAEQSLRPRRGSFDKDRSSRAIFCHCTQPESLVISQTLTSKPGT